MASSDTRIWDVTYPARTDFDTHRHAEAYLCLVTEGEYREWRPGAREVGSDRIERYEAGSTHAVRTGERGLRLLHVSHIGGNGRGDADRLHRGLLLQIAHEVQRATPETDAGLLHLESLCHDLRGDPWDATGRQSVPPWLRRIAVRLREESARTLTLSKLARDEDVHPAHLSRAFRRRFGMTPGEYLRRIRVAHAVRLLHEEALPAAQAARAAGFCDQSHMGRWFRRFLAVTPGSVARRGARAMSRS